MPKKYLSADNLLSDSFKLAAIMFNDGLRPDWIAGVWRGGTPVAIAVHEYFAYHGHNAGHCPLQAMSYTGIGKREEVKLSGLQTLIKGLNPGQTLLVVDDVFDSGNSAHAIREFFKPKCSPVFAMPWYKPANNKTGMEPDYYLHQTSDWLIFPHELQGLSEEELKYKFAAKIPWR